MNTRQTIASLLAAAALGGIAFTASASDDNTANSPLSQAEVASIMEAAGYSFTEFEFEDGEIEAEGTKDGVEWEVVIDAATGKIVSDEQDD